MRNFNAFSGSDHVDAEMKRREQERKLQKECKDLYRSMISKIHPDLNGGGTSLDEEAKELAGTLNDIRESEKDKYKSRGGAEEEKRNIPGPDGKRIDEIIEVKTWSEMLEELKNFQNGPFKEFMEKKAGGEPSDGGKESKKEKKERERREKKEKDEKFESDIAGADDFDELFRAIESAGGIQGRGEFFNAKELIELIEEVRKGEKKLTTITRNLGLRIKVEELMKKEKEGAASEKSEEDEKEETEAEPKKESEKEPEEMDEEPGPSVGNFEEPEASFEKDDKEAELMEAVKSSRDIYARKEYEANNIIKKLKNSSLFGKFLKSKPEDIVDVKSCYEAYKTALNELLTYQRGKLENGAEPEGGNEKVENLLKYFNQDEKTNLYDAYTDARAKTIEDRFGKIPGKLAKGSSKVINYYRKLNWKTKIGVGIVAGLSGAGLVMAGQRVIGGIAAGTGVTAGLEARYRQKEEKRLAEERASIKEQIGKENPEKSYEMMMEKMQAEIEGYAGSLKTERDKARNRKIMGASVAVFLGSGAASYLIQETGAMHGIKDAIGWVGEKTGISDAISDTKHFWGNMYDKYFGHHDIPSVGASDGAVSEVQAKKLDAAMDRLSHPQENVQVEHPTSIDLGKDPNIVPQQGPEATVGGTNAEAAGAHASEVPKAEIPPATNGTPENITASEVRPDVVSIQKGSSFEGTIKRYLTEQGIKSDEAGKQAHKMWSEYVKANPDPTGHDYFTIHPNAQMEISLDSEGQYHVASFEDSPKADWNKIISADEKIAAQNIDATNNENVAEIPKPEVAPEAVPENPTGNTPGGAVDEKIAGSPDKVMSAEETIKALDPNMPENIESVMAPEGHEMIGNLNNSILADNVLNFGGRGSEATVAAAGIVGLAGGGKVIELAKMRKEKNRAEKDRVLRVEFIAKAKDAMKNISLGKQKNWEVLKGLKFSEIRKRKSNVDINLRNSVKNFEKEMMKLLGKQAKANKDEDVKKWLARVLKESLGIENNAVEEEKRAA